MNSYSFINNYPWHASLVQTVHSYLVYGTLIWSTPIWSIPIWSIPTWSTLEK